MKSHFLPDSTYTELRVTWFNPYTSPENGIRHLWACCVPWPRTSDDEPSYQIAKELFETTAPKCPKGYCQAYIVGGSIKPVRKMSAQGKRRSAESKWRPASGKKPPYLRISSSSKN